MYWEIHSFFGEKPEIPAICLNKYNLTVASWLVVSLV